MLLRAIAAVAGALAVTGVASAIRPDNPAPTLTISITSGPEPERLRSALMAVHAYVEKRRTAFAKLLGNVTTPTMRDAAKVIAGSDEGLAVAAKLLATVRLVAHARTEADAIDAVDIMIGQRVRERLLRWLDEHRQHDRCDEDEDAERTVSEGLRAALGEAKPESSLIAPGACSDFFPYSHVGSPSGSNDVTIRMNATAGRAFDDARARLDPRSWASCSTVWAETYLVETRNDRPVFENGKPKPRTIPQPLGGSFRNETLYERVQCDGKCSLEVLLDVTASRRGDTYLLHFGEPLQLSGSPGIEVDYGDIEVKKVGARVDVKSHKTIGFTREADADLVLMLLRSIDMAAHLQRLVCCEAP